jgi:hypothetical protein
MNSDRTFSSSLKRIVPSLALVSLAATLAPVKAQGTRADYDRADRLEARTQDEVFHAHVHPHWLPDNNAKIKRMPATYG